MSPSNLQGLNLIPPAQPQNPYLSDSQELLNLPHFPELDLWTNLAFQSDEPLVRHHEKKPSPEQEEQSPSVEDDEDDDTNDGQPARPDNHDNVSMGNPVSAPSNPPRTGARALNGFDISSLLAGFGVDPFAAPPVQSSSTPSLAQILALYPNAAYPPPPPSASGDSAQPAAKRARTRRTSVSVGADDHASEASSAPAPAPTSSTPVTAAEDKRRRNTAASARFRLKKKEREAALEKKSKELELRVTELERECEGLRRENGWLKGLVVGVTGAGAAQQQQQGGPAGVGVKRPRDADGVSK
ncbi:hypothetical protein BC834DRAFT_923178 [Gloeopeniophorella convolvens]|nr:hypothetical protein BC834DRAFT_923178 [Gloeopeniophorella convolvens]